MNFDFSRLLLTFLLDLMNKRLNGPGLGNETETEKETEREKEKKKKKVEKKFEDEETVSPSEEEEEADEDEKDQSLSKKKTGSHRKSVPSDSDTQGTDDASQKKGKVKALIKVAKPGKVKARKEAGETPKKSSPASKKKSAEEGKKTLSKKNKKEEEEAAPTKASKKQKLEQVLPEEVFYSIIMLETTPVLPWPDSPTFTRRTHHIGKSGAMSTCL